jgi:hypothetical protein
MAVRKQLLCNLETIHGMEEERYRNILDGNGPLDRLLPTQLLSEQKMIQDHRLCLSLYFKSHRQYFYVRNSGWLWVFVQSISFHIHLFNILQTDVQI